jgi:hypothetical protein
MVFVMGQEFYRGPKFPSLDFSLVYILDESGNAVDMVIHKRGPEAVAARIIPAKTKLRLEIPEHLESLPGRLDELETLLGNATAASS